MAARSAHPWVRCHPPGRHSCVTDTFVPATVNWRAHGIQRQPALRPVQTVPFAHVEQIASCFSGPSSHRRQRMDRLASSDQEAAGPYRSGPSRQIRRRLDDPTGRSREARRPSNPIAGRQQGRKRNGPPVSPKKAKRPPPPPLRVERVPVPAVPPSPPRSATRGVQCE